MRKILIVVAALLMVALTMQVAFAAETYVDDCVIQNRVVDALTYVRSNCTSTTIAWENGGVDVSILGDLLPGEVVLDSTSAYVNSVARPDLDAPALITFEGVSFALEPEVYRDGTICTYHGHGHHGNCTTSWDSATRTFAVEADGFSNYSLQYVQDFTVYSDQEPELKNKVYQTIDLGNGDRTTEYKCIVQIYGMNEAGQYILVQTNPKREVQARLWGSPDANQPEALGYFKTENGLANVYFDGSTLYGYTSFQYVAQCASNTTLKIYEEPIDTRYSPAGRAAVGRGIWFAQGNNGFYVVMGILVVAVLIWFAAMYLRSVWKILRGY